MEIKYKIPNTLTDFHHNIINYIFEYLDQKSKIQLLQTCKFILKNKNINPGIIHVKINSKEFNATHEIMWLDKINLIIIDEVKTTISRYLVNKCKILSILSFPLQPQTFAAQPADTLLNQSCPGYIFYFLFPQMQYTSSILSIEKQ